MSLIAAAGSLGSALALAVAAPSGPVLAAAGFFGGGTLGGMIGAAAVAALGWHRSAV